MVLQVVIALLALYICTIILWPPKSFHRIFPVKPQSISLNASYATMLPSSFHPWRLNLSKQVFGCGSQIDCINRILVPQYVKTYARGEKSLVSNVSKAQRKQNREELAAYLMKEGRGSLRV